MADRVDRDRGGGLLLMIIEGIEIMTAVMFTSLLLAAIKTRVSNVSGIFCFAVSGNL